jgi:2'-5' RNA ligase
MSKFESALIAAAAQHSGAMIALVPTDEYAKKLSIEGYEPDEALHVTLFFLGSAANWDHQLRDELTRKLRKLADEDGFVGSVWGTASFNPNGASPCSVYLIRADGITFLRTKIGNVISEIPRAMDLMPVQHETFIPHMTAGYDLHPASLTYTGRVDFDRIRVSFAGDDVRDIPLQTGWFLEPVDEPTITLK